MPRRQVYGKRNTNVYSSFAGFTSPAKPRQLSVESPVLEVTEELAKLTVHEHISQEEGTDKASRRALGERDGNAVLHKPLSKSPAKKQTVKVESTQDNSEATQAPSPCTSEREQQVSATLKAVSESEAGSTTPALSEQLPLAASPPTNCLEATASEPQVPKISNLYTTYAEPLLSLSSHPLSSFSTWSDQLSSHFAVTKIAEASFGEVYRLALLRPHATLGRADESVLKIIALKPPEATRKRLSKAAKKRVEMMSDLEDVASEVRLMQRMTSIPGFTMFRECCVLQGRPGDSFVSAWRSWNESQKTKGKETSVFPDPGKKASYSENQLWAVIEMQDAGTDLENVNIHDIWTAWDVFWGVVLALGKGEDDVRFEHRDLHMGNICVSIRDRPLSSHYQCDYACIDANKTLGFTGIETTLIDYTISRAELTRNNGGGEDDVAFLDLEKDVALFEGDAEEEYQYEIYRYMRAAMYLDDPLADLYDRWDEVESSGRTWRGYHPQTNLVWLHFILHEMLKNVAWPSEDETLSESVSKTILEKAMLLEQAFSLVQSLLDPEQLPDSGLHSAGDLVQMALVEGWLHEEDVKGSAGISKTQAKRKARGVRKAKGQ